MEKFIKDSCKNRVYAKSEVNVAKAEAELLEDGFEFIGGFFRKTVNDCVSGVHQFAFFI